MVVSLHSETEVCVGEWNLSWFLQGHPGLQNWSTKTVNNLKQRKPVLNNQS